MNIVENISLVASIIMPLFNIPLIVKIVRRRSSMDISMSWVMGVWTCALLMAPAGLTSQDVVFRCFNIINLITFTGVVIAVWRYRK
jgi:hypothetical protein